MFPAHSIIRIITAKLEHVKDFWVLNMELETCVRRAKPGSKPEPKFYRYESYMYFQKEEQAKMWEEQMKPNRIVDVKFCEFQGKQLQADGSWKGFTKVRLYPDTRLTVPK